LLGREATTSEQRERLRREAHTSDIRDAHREQNAPRSSMTVSEIEANRLIARTRIAACFIFTIDSRENFNTQHVATHC
jgi:hypothetical protein